MDQRSAPPAASELDPAQLDRLERLGGAKLKRDVVRIFLSEAPGRRAAFCEALAGRDGATLGRLAHSLKSSSGNLGLKRLMEAVRGVEIAIEDGDADAAFALAVAVAPLLDRAVDLLQALP